MFNDLINSTDVPIQWTTCTVVPLYKAKKKGDIYSPSSYRSVFLQESSMKVTESLWTLKRKLDIEKAMSDYQFAYKSGCGCHTLIAKYIQITKTRKHGISLFFDIKLAFSSVNRKSMFNDIFHKLGRDAFIFK